MIPRIVPLPEGYVMLAKLSRLKSLIGFKDHNAGHWARLDDLQNKPRYREIERLRRDYAPFSSVLDVGCGAGVVRNHITTPARYLGIDSEPHAIEAARQNIRSDSREQFICGDISDLTLLAGQRFGFIVFAEVLYYQPSAQHAVQLVKSYVEKVLSPTGFFLVTTWVHPSRRGNTHVSGQVHKVYKDDCVSSTFVRCDTNCGWHLALYRPTKKQ